MNLQGGEAMQIYQYCRYWKNDTHAHAAAEAALIFPVLMTMLLGVFDVGNAILANQKTIRASQVTADLITRAREVVDADIDEAIEAGRLALTPLPITEYGVDIISIRFDEDAMPEIVWRETRNMSALDNILDNVAALAAPNEGVVVVAANYNFTPLFAGFVIDRVAMQELAFARGRLSSVVCKEGEPGC